MRVRIDNSGNKFPEFKTTIADLARQDFTDISKRLDTTETVENIFWKNWKFEIEAIEQEYASYVAATFKDGSRLTVFAYG